MRLRQPMKQRGVKTKRWARWHANSRAAVIARSRGRCESCLSRGLALEWAHLASRGNVISEPWCSTPELTAALCVDCHKHIDRGLAPERLMDLRWIGLNRLSQRYQLDMAMLSVYGANPLDGIRAAVRLLNESWEFDPDTAHIAPKG